MSQPRVASRVPALLGHRGPTAVAWLIVAIVVGVSVDGMARRPGAHVGKKVLEQIPSSANANPSPAVVLEAFQVGVRAAGPHLTPGHVLDRLREPMPSGQILGSFSAKATARGDAPAAKVASIYRRRLAAFTAADPSCFSFAGSLRGDAFDAQASVAMPGQIKVSLRHNAHSNPVSRAGATDAA